VTRRRLAALAAAGCAAGLAACDGGPGASKAFVSQADAACLQASAAIGPQNRPLSSLQQAAARMAQLAQIKDRELARLRKVTPPSAAQAAYEELLADEAQLLTLLRQRQGALERKDIPAYQRAKAESNRVQELTHAAARRAGLRACAAQLSAAERNAITSLIRAEETHPQASDCRTSVTDHFIAAHFRTVAACERELPKGASAGVRISGLRGTPPSATALVDELGGTAPTRTQRFSLFREGGRWRIDDIQPLERGGLNG
jgi:hypothetical protein